MYTGLRSDIQYLNKSIYNSSFTKISHPRMNILYIPWHTLHMKLLIFHGYSNSKASSKTALFTVNSMLNWFKSHMFKN